MSQKLPSRVVPADFLSRPWSFSSPRYKSYKGSPNLGTRVVVGGGGGECEGQGGQVLTQWWESRSEGVTPETTIAG